MQDPDTPPDSATTANESTYNPNRPLQKEEEESVESLERTPTHAKELWKFRLRPSEDDEPQ